MDVRISRISPIRTDFFIFLLGFRAGIPKKSVPIGEIRKIRISIRISMYPKVEPKNETSFQSPAA
ncbi:MAG: hypothetical protein RLZZ628_1214 [Bacteroidota bacterium]|jgi:hypothetical protein